jgi:hypothetical protein
MWSALKVPAAVQVTRLYLETCVLAVQDPARWRYAPEGLRGPGRAPLRDGLAAFGIPAHQAEALTDLILDTFDGLALHRLTASEPASSTPPRLPSAPCWPPLQRSGPTRRSAPASRPDRLSGRPVSVVGVPAGYPVDSAQRVFPPGQIAFARAVGGYRH